jgi:hypothetical protein
MALLYIVNPLMLASLDMECQNAVMSNTFDKETVGRVLGNVEHEGQTLQRTPLHVDFGPYRPFQPAVEIRSGQCSSKTVFNAIGSRCVGTDVYMPVIDVDRHFGFGVRGQAAKAVMGAYREVVYDPAKSWLREIMGDHGIDAEVGEVATHSYYHGHVKQYVGQIVLRAPVGVLDGVNSTSAGHGHVYIDKPFSEADHSALLDELDTLGVISPEWHKIAEEAGMGIVRTPWTEGERQHVVS